MSLFKKISSFFKKEEESFNIVDIDIGILKQEFKDSDYLAEGTLSEFPTIVSLIHYEIKAAYGLVLIDDRSYTQLKDFLLKKINLNIDNLHLNFVEKIIFNSNKYFLKIEKDFNGSIISLITSDQELLNDLVSLKLQPPPPWKATQLLPKDFLFPQGKEEYYWNTFWLRFYESLDEKALTQYLSQIEIPKSWQEYFEIRDS